MYSLERILPIAELVDLVNRANQHSGSRGPHAN